MGVAIIIYCYSIDWPDLQLQFVAGTVISDSGVKLRYNDGLKDSV